MSGMRRLDRSECAILPLVLTGRWFRMIERGEKREEYRAATQYWGKRLANWLDPFAGLEKVVEFRLGYAADAPRMAFAVREVFRRYPAPHPEWGEVAGEEHFVLRLGGRVELSDGKSSSRETPAAPAKGDAE